MKCVSTLVRNHSGVLLKVTSLFGRRGFNIQSVTVGVTEDPEISRMTFTVADDEKTISQLVKQLSKLEDVLSVKVLNDSDCIKRELCFIKVKAQSDKRSKIIEIADIFRARIIDVSKNTITLEITGDGDKTEAFIEMLSDFGICEVVRTGILAIERGEEMLSIK
ncbi:MAG: acetolactate synthase small subunit [Clostridiaceae bacterium]|nr:acetolactate synthase small subunit [Clostridiaceae bacterium]